ncbi:MAG TPA: sugar phosphate isomerase/epimerase family protein [Bryobacteraceae bacterium]|nr:sugar phosphate isomerase/epimerase family protein [Bryobacteraceae bacterium]
MENQEVELFSRRSSRRSVLQAGAAALVGGALLQSAPTNPTQGAAKLKVAIFSKHLLFLQGAQLAQAAASMGFDGIDLAVRKGGHVEPSRVKQDLPGLVAIIRQHGLEVPMLTTDVADTSSAYAEDILQCMSELNIRHYRWGGFKYTDDRSIPAQLDSLKPRVAKLAALNARYHVCAMYHTHSGLNLVGAPIWDLHELLTGFDPAAVGVNYDIGHATVEGGFGGWIDSFRVTGPYVRGIAVKDFLWEKNAHGQWRPAWKPLGQGMVNFPKFFQMVAASQFSGPLQLHFEYPLQGADQGMKTVSNPQEVFTTMRRDLQQLRGYLSQAGLA